MSGKVARKLLRRYRMQQCTDEERRIVEQWYQSLDDREDPNISESDLNVLEHQMLNDISARIDHSEVQNIQSPHGHEKVISIPARYLVRVAAMLVAAIVAGVFYYRTDYPLISHKQSIDKQGTIPSDVPLRVYLPDGTVVWLKETSKLHYPPQFSGSSREVTLNGEAFFDVAKNAEKPFIIHSTHFTTRVLGTSFNIRAYETDESQEVTVLTGRVVVSVIDSLTTHVKEVVLHRNQKAIYNKKDHSLTESNAAAHIQFGSLAKSKLVFKETSLENIIRVLNANYNVDITLSNDKMMGCMITADLSNETLEVSLAILSKAINASYTIAGRNIILTGSGCL